jgi:hypothetical protein
MGTTGWAVAAGLLLMATPVSAQPAAQPAARPALRAALEAAIVDAPLPGREARPGSQTGAAEASPSPWRTAFIDSLKLLAIEHGTRIAFQEKTRRELGGPFFRDYFDSVRIPTDWEDGDSWLVNYVGHPIHGAASGYLFRDAAGVTSQDFALTTRYWAELGKATAWIAIYSAQFEFGPLSEASIGNVGLTEDTRGWVDHAVTPTVGFAFMALEDALDRYLVQLIERHTGNRFLRGAARIVFNPSRMLANLAQGHLPWYRAGRPISGR